MKHIKPLLLLIAVLVISSTSFAQNENTDDENSTKDTLSLKKGPIRNQFDYVLKKAIDFTTASGYQYKAVSPTMFSTLRSNTIDSLRTNRREILSLKSTVDFQTKEIERLKSSLEEAKTNLYEATDKKDSVSVLGLQINKYTYNIITLSIIIPSLVLFLLFLFKYKESHKITKTAKQQLAEVEAEFEEHRKNALEREQKVRRQLIDEINKNTKKK